MVMFEGYRNLIELSILVYIVFFWLLKYIIVLYVNLFWWIEWKICKINI